MANFQELKSIFNIITIFNSYWNHVEQVRNNVMSKYCEVCNENFLEDIRNLFALLYKFHLLYKDLRLSTLIYLCYD